MTPEELENNIRNIQERNKRVELDKAWETSWTRRLLIAVIIYIIAAIWLVLIHDSSPLLKAIVPSLGYILSTLTIPFIKNLWARQAKQKNSTGFTLIELLVVIAIIGLLATIITIATSSAQTRARDTKRKSDLSRIGQFLYASSCYLPNAGPGDYDIADLATELASKFPQYAQYASLLPKDPKTGSQDQANYRYQVNSGGHCVIYANLENNSEEITLTSISTPTPNGGNGALKGSTTGANGTQIYYQISK